MAKKQENYSFVTESDIFVPIKNQEWPIKLVLMGWLDWKNPPAIIPAKYKVESYGNANEEKIKEINDFLIQWWNFNPQKIKEIITLELIPLLPIKLNQIYPTKNNLC